MQVMTSPACLVEALTRRPWLAVVIMSLGFGLQHVAAALVDWQRSSSMFPSVLPFGVVTGLI